MNERLNRTLKTAGITRLHDFIAREPRPLLHNRAMAIVRRMEDEARLRELETAEPNT